MQRVAPEIATAYLTAQQPFMDNILAHENSSPWNAGLHVSQFGGSVPKMINSAANATAGAIWSPCSNDIDAASVEAAHTLGLKVVVWTVNTEADMRRMITLGVDGIISDYPNVLRRVAGEHGCALPPATPVSP